MSLKQFAGPLAISVLVAAPAPALAQATNWEVVPAGMSIARVRHGDNTPVPYYEARRRAYDNGYREGFKEGEKDARRGDRFAYQDEREFQRADRGYDRDYGDRERYRQIFRDGYIAGYSDGYSRLSRSGRYDGRQDDYGRQGRYGQQGGWGSRGGVYGRYPGGYYTPALDNGARDGYEKGLEDARRNRSFDPLRHSWYRSGDRHYERRYGSRDEYKDAYRRGFQRGYEQGYQEARYRW